MADTSSNTTPTLSALLSSSSSTSTFDASTQLSTNRAVGTLLDNLSGGNTDVVAALNGIAGAITSSIIGGSTGATPNALLRANGSGGISLKSGVITEDDSGNLANVNSISLPFSPNRLVASNAANPGALTTLAPGSSQQVLFSNGSGSLPSFRDFVDGIGWVNAFPTNGTVIFWLLSPFSFYITQTTTICTAGSATISWAINGVTIPGGANLVSISTYPVGRASGNFVPAGASVSWTISSVSGCQNMACMLAITRA